MYEAQDCSEDKYPAFIAVSIDVAGSTGASETVNAVCADEDHRLRSLMRIPEYLARAEARFIRVFRSHFGNIDRIFRFKSLGDEAWYSIRLDDLPEGELRRLCEAVVSSLLEVSGSSDRLFVFARPLDEEESMYLEAAKEIHQEAIELGVKCTVDIIESSFEASGMRARILANEIAANAQARQEKWEEEILKYSEPLGMGLGPGSPGKIKLTYRSDPVGPDVNRFFRIASEALPGTVQVGNRLWTYAGFVEQPPRLLVAGPMVEKVHETLKGIASPYAVRYIPMKSCDPLTSRTTTVSSIFDKTRTLLIDRGRLRSHGEITNGIEFFSWVE